MGTSSIEGFMRRNERKQTKFRYCIVPQCSSTQLKCPDKLFISLPRDPKARDLWQTAMRRNIFLGPKTNKYVCEDHFNLEEDLENYQYYKMMGKGNVNVKIKPGRLPHIFQCQKDYTNLESTTTFDKRRHHKYVAAAIEEHENSIKMQGKLLKSRLQNTLKAVELAKPITFKKDKGVQINIKTKLRSKSTQCNLKKSSHLKGHSF